MPYIVGIFIYPIKALNGVSVTKATVLKSGALQHDRELAILDQQGRFVNGKRHPKVHHKTLHAGSSVSLELRGKRLAVLTALFFLSLMSDAGLQYIV